ncbi:MAG: DUF6298 domain-containing protein [Saprospiraceae bacterium]|nr:hypothetical protein [Lewinella sp.]
MSLFNHSLWYCCSLALFLLACNAATHNSTAVDESSSVGDPKDYIQPYEQNPAYWSYRGVPVLLLGGTDNDNLYQSKDLVEQLDLLQSVGGNFVRNVMSYRDEGDLIPYLRDENGKYDLTQWNPAYWEQFEHFLQLARDRDIIVQIELWDRFDYSQANWTNSPFNPVNNVNYTLEEIGLDEEYPEHPHKDLQPFFHTVPGMDGYQDKLDKLRSYQNALIQKMLSYSLNYGNVLYCMDNETSTPLLWGKYWSTIIRQAATEKAVPAYTTEMIDQFWRPGNCANCEPFIQDAKHFNFLDISQVNSRNFGQTHWDSLRYIMQIRSNATLRPANTVKIYGGNNTNWGSGSNQDGVERFCRNIFGGCAGVRHHRPLSGNGLNEKSQASIRAVRKLEEQLHFWEMSPRMELLNGREENEAYLVGKADDSAFAVYFPLGGTVNLKTGAAGSTYQVGWISLETGRPEGDPIMMSGETDLTLTPPVNSGSFAYIIRQ